MKKANTNHSPDSMDTIRIDKRKFTLFDAADFLHSEEDMVLYLHAVLDDGTDFEITSTLQDIARALIRKFPSAASAA